MGKIVSFVVCDSVNNIPVPQNGFVPTLVAPQIALRPPFIPGTFSFAMAVGIADIDLQNENKMRFVVVNPEGEAVHDTGENAFPIVPDHDVMPKEYQGFMINMDIRNMAIQCEGEYRFIFHINGECIGEHKVPIFKRVM